jgi:hypothetical protein
MIFGSASKPILLSMSAYASVTRGVGSSLLPHTVTSAPSAPAARIISRARSRSGGSFGLPQGQSSTSSASSLPGMPGGRKEQPGCSSPAKMRAKAGLSIP